VPGADRRPKSSPGATGAPHVTGAPTVPGPIGVDPLSAPLTYPGTPPRRPAVLVTDDAVLAIEPRGDAHLGEWLLSTGSSGANVRPASEPTSAVTAPSVSTIVPSEAVFSPIDGPGSSLHSDASHPDVHHPDPGRPDSRLEARPSQSGHREGRLPDPGHSGPYRRAATAAVAEGGRERWEGPLDRYLRSVGGPPAASRTPVLAVGSNASPAQLQRKLSNVDRPTLVPITAVSVHGLVVGVSAHVSRPGYLPATPVPSADARSDLWILWLDEAELAAVDATEPNYDRVRLPDRCPVRLTTGGPVTGCWGLSVPPRLPPERGGRTAPADRSAHAHQRPAGGDTRPGVAGGHLSPAVDRTYPRRCCPRRHP
jgi:hypothetical protein